MSADRPRYDVVIAGGGPAGLAAGLFTARHKLNTIVLDRGKSLLRQCAYLDNYLGFPGGIDVSEFLDLARAHALDAGCQVSEQRVTEVVHAPSGPSRFLVRTQSGESLLADRFVAATGCNVDYLRGLDAPELFDARDELCAESIDAYGRTSIDGLYVAGPLSGVENQALISAGQGAQVALGLIRDIRQADGLWEAIARHLDWQVRQGCYESERWAGRVHRYFEDSVAERSDLDSARVHELVEEWIRAKRAQQLDKTEVRRRREYGRRWRAEHAWRALRGHMRRVGG